MIAMTTNSSIKVNATNIEFFLIVFFPIGLQIFGTAKRLSFLIEGFRSRSDNLIWQARFLRRHGSIIVDEC